MTLACRKGQRSTCVLWTSQDQNQTEFYDVFFVMAEDQHGATPQIPCVFHQIILLENNNEQTTIVSLLDGCGASQRTPTQLLSLSCISHKAAGVIFLKHKCDHGTTLPHLKSFCRKLLCLRSKYSGLGKPGTSPHRIARVYPTSSHPHSPCSLRSNHLE